MAPDNQLVAQLARIVSDPTLNQILPFLQARYDGHVDALVTTPMDPVLQGQARELRQLIQTIRTAAASMQAPQQTPPPWGP